MTTPAEAGGTNPSDATNALKANAKKIVNRAGIMESYRSVSGQEIGAYAGVLRLVQTANRRIPADYAFDQL